MPTTALFGLTGDTASAETLPLPGVMALARTQELAWLSVRQMYQPPVHICCGFTSFIMNGAMKRKPGSPMIPVTASKKLRPPLVDFVIERPVYSANSTFVFVGSTAM